MDGRPVFFDSHVHVSPSETPSEFYGACKDSGVTWLLVCASDLCGSHEAAKFVSGLDGCLFAAGVHPHESSRFEGSISQFKEFGSLKGFVAIGEIGIDYHYTHSSKESQRSMFARMLSLALELGKPAVVHCRDGEGSEEAYETCFDLLSAFSANGGRFVLHCFAGTPQWVGRFLPLGAYFGVGGLITFPKAQNVRDSVMEMPIERILLETDSPYLAPVPHRGKPNHPSFLVHVAERLSGMKGMSVDDIALATTANAKGLFMAESAKA